MQPAASKTLALRTSQITYPGAAEYIRRVRDDLRPLLTSCPMADDVILCVSELAANAALHSNSRLPGGTFTVRVEISPGHYARIEIEDCGGPWTPATPDSAGHHGLDIVRTLATDYGIEGDRTTRSTWARFDWPEQP
jgi:anti-sigma regulatory factor (Ser/Thr protein kinase)